MKQRFSTKESGEITNMSIKHNRRFPFKQKFLKLSKRGQMIGTFEKV